MFGKSEERVNVLNRAARSFFFLIQKVMFEDILLHIGRLTDPPRQRGHANLTVRALPELIEDQELMARVEQHVEDVLEDSTFARQHRHQRLAHIDLETIRGESSRTLEPATRDTVNRVLNGFRKILNEVEVAYLGSTVYYEDGAPGLGGSDALAHNLAAGLYLREKWDERLRRGEVDPGERQRWNV